MLLKFSVANFLSFNQEQTLDLEATSAKEHLSNIINTNSKRLLKSIAIYGPNASGKTNLLQAMDFARHFVSRSVNYQKGDKIPVAPFAFATKTKAKPAQFELSFIADKVRYLYGFKVNAERVLEEWLCAYPSNRPQKWFTRKYDLSSKKYKWDFGNNLKGEVHSWKDQTLENTLFLSRATQLNSKQLSPVFLWFENLMMPKKLDPKHTTDFCLQSDKNKQKVLDFLKIADDSIKNITVEKKAVLFANLPPAMQRIIKNNTLGEKAENLTGTEVKTNFLRRNSINNQLVDLDSVTESAGTIKIFLLASYWLDALKEGRLLIIDELDRSLHPLLAKHLIERFNDKELNKNGAQLIFNCHDTSLLDTSILRRDQIWFTEKTPELATELFSLAEFSPRKQEAIEKGYLNGRYGAIPFIDEGVLSE